MPTLAEVQFLKFLFKMGSSVFSLIPIQITSVGFHCRVHVDWKQKNRKFIMWILFLNLSLIYNIFNFCGHLSEPKFFSNLLIILFQGFLIISKMGAFLCFLMFNINTLEICQFFNCVFLTPNGIARGYLRNIAYEPLILTNNYIFLFSLLVCGVGVNIMFSFMVPAMCLLFSSTAFWIFNVAFQTILMVPIGVTAANAVAVAFVALHEIRTDLKQIQQVFKANRYTTNEVLRYRMALLYRQIQILVVIGNKSFQNYLWPAFQFFGAMCVIFVMYPLLAFHGQMPVLFQVGLGFLGFGIGLICCIILNLGSQSLVYSTEILRHSKKLSNCEWSVKFFRSCPSISLSVGEFHKMDMERVPAFVRFILQRTLFLVLKTRTSTY